MTVATILAALAFVGLGWCLTVDFLRAWRAAGAIEAQPTHLDGRKALKP